MTRSADSSRCMELSVHAEIGYDSFLETLEKPLLIDSPWYVMPFRHWDRVYSLETSRESSGRSGAAQVETTELRATCDLLDPSRPWTLSYVGPVEVQRNRWFSNVRPYEECPTDGNVLAWLDTLGATFRYEYIREGDVQRRPKFDIVATRRVFKLLEHGNVNGPVEQVSQGTVLLELRSLVQAELAPSRDASLREVANDWKSIIQLTPR